MEPVSQQQARQQPTAATHRGTGAKQSVYALQQTNQHAPRDQPCAQDSGHLADPHQRIDQLVQTLNTGHAGVEQRLRRLEDDRLAELNKNFEEIGRRLIQLEQERGERQAVMKGCNDAVMGLEKRQADTEERINELEWEMGEMTRVRSTDFQTLTNQTNANRENCQTLWDNLQTLNQTQIDVIGSSNKDIHKGTHMEGKGEVRIPPPGRVTQGVGGDDPAPPKVVSNPACHSLGAPERELNVFQGEEEQSKVTPHQGEGEARAPTHINNHFSSGPGEEQENLNATLNEDMPYFQERSRAGTDSNREQTTGVDKIGPDLGEPEGIDEVGEEALHWGGQGKDRPPLVDEEKCAPTSANHNYIQERRPLLFQDNPTGEAREEKPPKTGADYAPIKTPQGPSAATPLPRGGEACAPSPPCNALVQGIAREASMALVGPSRDNGRGATLQFGADCAPAAPPPSRGPTD